jgi:Tfp pilus assembly protein PilF
MDLNPKESSYKTALAYIQISHYKQFKSAEQLLRQALEANLSDSQAHYRLGMLLIEKLGLRKEGESELKTALSQDPENREIKTAVERFAR